MIFWWIISGGRIRIEFGLELKATQMRPARMTAQARKHLALCFPGEPCNTNPSVIPAPLVPAAHSHPAVIPVLLHSRSLLSGNPYWIMPTLIRLTQNGQLDSRLQHQIPIIPSRYDPHTISHSPVTKLDSRLKTAGMTTGEYGNDDGGLPNVGNLYSAFILYNDRGRASVA